MAGVSLEFIEAGCNRSVDALDWGLNGLIAFAAHNAVALFEPSTNRVLRTLRGHKGTISCVHWLEREDGSQGPTPLVSGAADNSVIVWRPTTPDPRGPWEPLAHLSGHTGPINCIRSLPYRTADGSDAFLLITTAGDLSVRVWRSEARPGSPVCAAWEPVQSLEVGTRMQVCCAVAALPIAALGGADAAAAPPIAVLALGGVDGAIRTLVGGVLRGGEPFREVCRLSGHQDWVRSLAFLPQGPTLVLASASQDRNVRLWAVRPAGSSSAGAEILMRYAPRPTFPLPGGAASLPRYEAVLDSVLVGHEDWAHSVTWRPKKGRGREEAAEAKAEAPVLLTASMDRTMMIWRKDEASGIWMSVESLGDLGASHLGYYTARFSPDGLSVVAHGYTGSLHAWRRRGGLETGPWEPFASSMGHCGAVTDLCFTEPPAAVPRGKEPSHADTPLLVSVSEDQTARVRARAADSAPGAASRDLLQQPSQASTVAALQHGRWCEIARPQVHGHDIACVAVVPQAASSPSQASPGIVFASGSEEKVIRVFESPAAFLETLGLAVGGAAALQDVRQRVAGLPAFGATVPTLGLSNKALSKDDVIDVSSAPPTPDAGEGGLTPQGGSDFIPHSAPSAVPCPPLEEHLAHNTLWPEVQKVYGHGNELFCVAADPSGALFASACRAQSAAAAEIWVWNTDTWTPRQHLAAHSLTVTQLEFSRSGRFLAASSRDRSVSLFARGGGSSDFCLASKLDKAHGRIVWGLSINSEETILATGSRDKTVKLWSIGEGGALASAGSLPAFASGATAVQFGPPGADGAARLLAVGLESGDLMVFAVDKAPSGIQSRLLWTSDPVGGHSDAITRVRWAPDALRPGTALLATAGRDSSVRVHGVQVQVLGLQA